MLWVKFQQYNETVNAIVTKPKLLMDPLSAAIYTVKCIVKEYPPPYTLMLSGGIDSQAMLWAWLMSGEEFNTCTVKFNGGLNDHDLEQIVEFAKIHKIGLTFKNFDALGFFQNEFHDWANKYQCVSPMLRSHMKMCSDIDGTVIFSGNFLDKNTSRIDYTILGMHRFATTSGKSVVPFFFMETPELAFVFHPILYSLGDVIDDYQCKIDAYTLGGFPVIPQPKKSTGFEKIKDLYDDLYRDQVSAKTRMEFSDKPSKRMFEVILPYPLEKKFKQPKLNFVFKDAN